MRGRFITALQFLTVAGDLGRGDKIDETTFITNNKDQINSLIPNEIVPIIGIMETDSIKNSPVVVYSNEEIDEEIEPEKFVINKSYDIISFLHTIWLFKDNSINKDLSFLFYGNKKFEYVHSNFIAVRYSNSKGTEESINITRSELQLMRKFNRERLSVHDYSLKKLTKLETGTERISRAFYHLSGARNTQDLGIKISCYCSALEALFATSQAELAHQLAERVASFVSDEPAMRLTIYRTVKSAYRIRSKIVHGATIRPSKVGELPDLSELIDDLMRASMVKILSDDESRKAFEAPAERFDEFMLNRIFRA